MKVKDLYQTIKRFSKNNNSISLIELNTFDYRKLIKSIDNSFLMKMNVICSPYVSRGFITIICNGEIFIERVLSDAESLIKNIIE